MLLFTVMHKEVMHVDSRHGMPMITSFCTHLRCHQIVHVSESGQRLVQPHSPDRTSGLEIGSACQPGWLSVAWQMWIVDILTLAFQKFTCTRVTFMYSDAFVLLWIYYREMLFKSVHTQEHARQILSLPEASLGVRLSSLPASVYVCQSLPVYVCPCVSITRPPTETF